MCQSFIASQDPTCDWQIKNQTGKYRDTQSPTPMPNKGRRLKRTLTPQCPTFIRKGVDLLDKAETRRDVLSGVTQERNLRSKIR